MTKVQIRMYSTDLKKWLREQSGDEYEDWFIEPALENFDDLITNHLPLYDVHLKDERIATLLMLRWS